MRVDSPIGWLRLYLVEGLADVGQNVVTILDTYGEADEVGSNASLAQLLVAHLSMGMRGGMEHTGAGIGNMGNDGYEAQRVHKFDGGLAVALESEGNHSTGAVGQILLCKFVGLVAGESAIVYPCHTGVGLQELGYALGILTVAGHTQMERLQSEVQQERVLRCGNAAQVAHELRYELGAVGHLAKALGVDDAVIRLVGSGESGELVGMGLPVEVTAVYYASAHLSGMTVHILGSGMGDDIGTPLKGPAVDRCGEGVVNYQGHAMLMSDAGKLLDVEHFTARIGDGLAEEGLGVGTESSVNLVLSSLGRNEGTLDAKFFEGHTEKIVGATVNLVGGDEVVASLTDVEQGIEIGCLSGRGEHSPYSTLEGCYLAGHGIVGGVLKTGVEVAFLLQVEEVGHFLGVIILKSGALDDGEHAWVAILGLPACLYAKRSGLQ